MRGKTKIVVWAVAVIGMLLLGLLSPGQVPVLAQQPTGSVPTVTGTPEGPVFTVDPSIPIIRVYAGPGSFDYPSIGVLLASETAPAIGRAKGKEDWIQIRYEGVPGAIGWVYGLYGKLTPGANLTLVELPPTPTAIATPTIDPVLQAAYIGQQTPTRMPTFTPPAPLDEPVFTDAPGAAATAVPVGLLILSLGLFGFLGAAISYLRGR